MLTTYCFVDTDTMCLMFVTPQTNTTEFKVVEGNLNISFQYED